MRAALVQLRTPDSHTGALAHVEPLIREAAAQGAGVVVTPEGTNILERDRSRLLTQLVSYDADPVVCGLQALAAELAIEIVIGSAFVAAEDGSFANRSLHLGKDGAIIAHYDKMHMFDADLPDGEVWQESKIFTAGDRPCVTPSGVGKLGLTICYDLRFPHLFQSLARSGADIIAVPAAFTCLTGRAHWEILLRARAIENGCFILAPAQGGKHADGRATWGRSMVISPWGTILAKAAHDEPAVVVFELDLNEVGKARRAFPITPKRLEKTTRTRANSDTESKRIG